jgi:hypothetical protein
MAWGWAASSSSSVACCSRMCRVAPPRASPISWRRLSSLTADCRGGEAGDAGWRWVDSYKLRSYKAAEGGRGTNKPCRHGSRAGTYLPLICQSTQNHTCKYNAHTQIRRMHKRHTHKLTSIAHSTPPRIA